MANIGQGSIRLFRFRGIDTFLHWSWFLVAAYEINVRRVYPSLAWNAAEYLALFLIVMLHEYGHALACKSIGGTADHIVLWPLGGVAYVNPPQRPGATLWSIAAGPLVNVALIPVFGALLVMARSMDWATSMPNAQLLVRAVWTMNLSLLIFNLLPIYPLDGGQILRSLLWYVMGRGRSLMTATILGLIGVTAFIAFAVWAHSIWFAGLAIFIVVNCWNGLQRSRAMLRLAKLPAHEGFKCPACNTAPKIGRFWKCGKCQTIFDTFQSHAVCPQCKAAFPLTMCIECRAQNRMDDWMNSAIAVQKL